MTSLASDTIAELADEMIFTSKFCMSSRVRGEEADVGGWRWNGKQDGVSGVDGVGQQTKGLGDD